jgi:uncharacterized protein YjbI with pentapeptide repeats
VVSGGITGTPANLPYYPNGQYKVTGGYLVGPGANLAGANLAGLNLTGAALDSGINLAGADLTGADLAGDAVTGSLAGTELAGANLTGIESLGITGTPASLPTNWAGRDNYLLGPTVNLYEQTLSGDLTSLDLVKAYLYHTNLAGADLDGTNLAGATLWYTNLTGASTVGASFTSASWSYATCPDGTDSNIYIDGCFSPRDTTPPVLHLNVGNGQVFAIGRAPKVQCTATDKYSQISVQPTLKISGQSSHGLGKFTATCSGAVDLAGLTAKPISATYWIAYGFDGMFPQQGEMVPTYPRTLKVHFFLSGRTNRISATAAWAMVHKQDVKVTLRGPYIKATTALCGSYSSSIGFVCKLALPHGRTGRSYSYKLTAFENNGFGFVRAPGEPAENPVTIHFK